MFEYVYFNIYQYYSRQSDLPDSLAVRLKCMYLLSLSAGGWILFLQSLFLRFVRIGWFSSHGVAAFNALAVFTTITIAFYRIFIIEGRDQKIFDKYITTWQENKNKKRDLFIASFVASVPYLSMIGIRIFIHQ